MIAEGVKNSRLTCLKCGNPTRVTYLMSGQSLCQRCFDVALCEKKQRRVEQICGTIFRRGY